MHGFRSLLAALFAASILAAGPGAAAAQQPGLRIMFITAQQPQPQGESQPPTFVDRQFALLHALDKISARVSQMQVRVGEEARFARLAIRLLACRMRPPEEPPESAAFMEIVDAGRDGRALEAFRGWMFASSPSLSAMEHPLYDIWVARGLTAEEAANAVALERSGGVEDMSKEKGKAGAPSSNAPPAPYKRAVRQ